MNNEFIKNWSIDFAEKKANELTIVLSEEHKIAITFFRDFYIKHETTPTIRTLLKVLKEKFPEKEMDSIKLSKLFPGKSSAQTICILAGLPKPKRCI